MKVAMPTFLGSSLLTASAFFLLACGGGGDDDDDIVHDPPPGADEPVDPPAVPGDRIDHTRAAEYDNDAYVALGRGRSGSNGSGTPQSNTTVRYVSGANGDDSADGSEPSPWQTLQHAADSIDPGTTVLVDDSADYAGLDIERSGAPDAYLIFMNREPGRMPRIVGDGQRQSVVDIDASYVILQGFEVADQNVGGLEDDEIGIQIEPRHGDITHIEVRNNLVHDIGPGQVDESSCSYNAHAIIAQAEGYRLSGLIFDGNEIHHAFVGNSEVLVVNGNIDDFYVTNNYVHDVDNIAIDVIGYEKNDRETTRDGVVADNVVLDASNYFPYCTRGNCTYPAGDQSSDGVYVDGGADLVIEYNVVGRTDHGIELQSENGQLIRNVDVRFNIVFNSNYQNFTLGPAEGSQEHDNAFFDDPALADTTLEGCRS